MASYTGNTPAEAGKTEDEVFLKRFIKKHPRRGGEDCKGKGVRTDLAETPPPRRGRRRRCAMSSHVPGNTPAEAGKTATYGSCLLK